MNVHDITLGFVSDPAVIAVVCTFLALYAASPSRDNPVSTLEPVRYVLVGLIAAFSTARNPTISVIMLLTFFCVVGQNNPEQS